MQNKQSLPSKESANTGVNSVSGNNIANGVSPSAIMELAMNKDLDLDRIEKMLEIQAKWEAMEAKKSFAEAMSRFKKTPIVLTKDSINKQYNSKYTSIGNLVNTVVPPMSKEGLTHRWDIKQNGKEITVVCIITHTLGHSELTEMSGPADETGAKNPIQQIKSTRTYLQSATLESALGIASSASNVDDDGNGAGNCAKHIDKAQQNNIVDLLAAIDYDEKKFLDHFKWVSIEGIPSKSYSKAVCALEKRGIKQ